MNQTSLLAHLYPYFKGSQEDVATTSLCYIIANEYINNVFTSHAAKVLGIATPQPLQYYTQAVGENLERPDIAGIDYEGKEILLCEAKFYAALTVNQPETYLKRLIDEHGTGLIFICPEIRKKGLWHEILERAEKEFTVSHISEFCSEINASVRLGITTWKEILYELEQAAAAYATDRIHDIKQLQGYCEQLDRDAFIPFSEEDLGIDMAMKAERPYILLDALIDSFRDISGHIIKIDGYRPAPVWSAYRRYIDIDGYSLSISYDTKKWKDSESNATPFWMLIKNKQWKQTDYIINILRKIPSAMKCKDQNGEHIALIPKRYTALSETVEDMKKQIFNYLQMFSKETEQ